MSSSEVLHRDKDLRMMLSLFDIPKGANVKSRAIAVEKKIEFLENLAGSVSNRRSRRWLNDRLLMELVPRLSGDEIRGLFAPPPWGDDVPLSPFSMTYVGEWDRFRTIDMDKERTNSTNNDKVAVLRAWHRVDCRTREAIRRSFLYELINNYEECLRAFIEESDHGDVLALHVQDPFHRLLLHGVCEFYNLNSVTDTEMEGRERVKMTKIKKRGSTELPNVTLCDFLRMSKEGIW